MILEWLAGQLDYILLWHGLALALLPGLCQTLSRKCAALPWRWLGLFKERSPQPALCVEANGVAQRGWGLTGHPYGTMRERPNR